MAPFHYAIFICYNKGIMKSEAQPIIEHYVIPEAVKDNTAKWKEHYRVLSTRARKTPDRQSPEYLEAMDLLEKDLAGIHS